MPGYWRRAFERKLPQLQAYDALLAIEAALLPHASEADRKARIGYWQGIRDGDAHMLVMEPRSNVVPFGNIVARDYNDLAAWLGKANRDMAGTS